jgi:hypothetical protein
MTQDQEDQIEPAALRLAVLPVERRDQLYAAIGRAYGLLFARAFPDASDQEMQANADLYAMALVRRVRQIDASTGGPPVGSA